ncbi:hypothetical protein CCR97_17695 [Rhodoplanes elegans]|uniref:Uncharacterized protein n=1 Tax=Rhodoplanes elegans TaxID=29408 RepID=A0A327KTU5_9BRAD|nr:hypothetical protein [Rhodoplanes elegans]MBK5960024.1 hypothetical protein [Rhodoplanes elegans]RAI41761.1 hypothetical protein CH338_02085 [Rhodoplanes elegans]
MHRARRATVEGRRLLAEAGPAGRRRAGEGAALLAGVAELVEVLRALVAERDRVAAELAAVDQRSRAVTAYRTCALSTRPPRATRS